MNNRILIAIILSIFLHLLLLFVVSDKGQDSFVIEDKVQASKSQISLSLVKKKFKPKKLHGKREKFEKKYEKLEQENIPLVESDNYSIDKIAPKYPKRALRRGQEGIVELKVLVSEDGLVKNIEIINSSGYYLLDKAAIDAVRNWKFRQLSEKKSLNWVKVPVEFVIR